MLGKSLDFRSERLGHRVPKLPEPEPFRFSGLINQLQKCLNTRHTIGERSNNKRLGFRYHSDVGNKAHPIQKILGVGGIYMLQLKDTSYNCIPHLDILRVGVQIRVNILSFCCGNYSYQVAPASHGKTMELHHLFKQRIQLL